MKSSYQFGLAIALALGVTMLGLAQEESVDSQDPANVKQSAQDMYSRAIWATLNLPSSDLAAEDGHYLAQDKTELQTYYDLKLSYQYMSENYLRRQLRIADDEGIILTAADESGQGYKNGFRDGDIVLQVDDKPVKTQYELVIALSQDRGNERRARLLREGKPLDLSVVLTASDEPLVKHWVIGVSVDEISDLTKTQLKLDGGVAISQLSENGAAQEAGIQVHDVVTHADGKPINTLESLKSFVKTTEGKKLTLDLIREGNKLSIDVEPKQFSVTTAKDLQSASLNMNQSLLWDASLAGQSGELTLVPKVLLDPQSSYAVAWQHSLQKAQGASSSDDQSKRIGAIEATLKLLQEQLQELKSAEDQ